MTCTRGKRRAWGWAIVLVGSVAAVAAARLSVGTGGAHSRALDKGLLLSFEVMLDGARSADDQMNVARRMAETARTADAVNGEYAAMLFSRAATIAEAAGDEEACLDMLREAVVAAGLPPVRAAAALHLGDRLCRKDPAEAEALYRQAQALMREAVMPDRRLEAVVARQLGESLRAQGKLADAVLAREACLEAIGDDPRAEQVAMSLITENAADCFKLGDTAGGKRWYEELFIRYPDWGWDDGSIVAAKLHAAKEGRDDFYIKSPEYIDALYDLWSDPELAALPESLTIGNNLAANLRESRRYEEQAEVLIDMLRRIQSHEAGWTRAWPERTAATRDVIRTALASLAIQGGFKRRDAEALEAAHEFLQRFPDDELADSVREAASRAAEGLGT